MLFNIKVPRSGSFVALLAALPVFLSYVLGIYWNNHHHLCRHPSLSRAEFSGPIFICFFGFRSPRSRRRGWDKTTWPLPPCRSTDSFCSVPGSLISFLLGVSSPIIEKTRSWRCPLGMIERAD